MPHHQSTTFYIDPDASTNGNGSMSSPFNTWNGLTLKAGDSYLQEGGTTFNGTLTLTEHGTASAPINIGSYGTGQPSINGDVIFNGASHVTLSGFNISGANFNNSDGTGITIYSPSSNITIENNSIHDNLVWGVFVNSTNPVTINGNDIYHNGGGGVELEGQNTIVEFNLVQNNGWDASGYAGIHTYSPPSGTAGYNVNGSYNTIEYNVITGQMAGPNNASTDGEAILLDQWTHNNTVTGNLTNGNEANGLHIFGAYDNTLTDNASIGDVLGVGNYAELAINNDGSSDDPASGNVATGNVLVPETAGTVAVYDEYASENTITGSHGASSEAAWLTYFEASGGAPASLIGVAQSII